MIGVPDQPNQFGSATVDTVEVDQHDVDAVAAHHAQGVDRVGNGSDHLDRAAGRQRQHQALRQPRALVHDEHTDRFHHSRCIGRKRP